MRAGFGLAAIAPFTVLLCACAPAPVQLYAGPPLPRDQISLVTVERAFNVDVVGIDGNSVHGSSWYVTPGLHGLWVRVNVFSRSEGMEHRYWSYCLIRLQAKPGGTHRVEAYRGDTREERSGFDRGSFALEAGRGNRGMTCSGARPKLKPIRSARD